MQCQTFTRRVYNRAKIDNVHIISSIRFKSFDRDESYRTVQVDNIAQYESGCHEHKQCFGHMCITPSNVVLPPQSMSMRMMEIETVYYAAAKLAFAGNRDEYTDKMKSTNYTKKGNMRSIMSTPVAGSARLIANSANFKYSLKIKTVAIKVPNTK